MSKNKVKDAEYKEMREKAEKPTMESSIETLTTQLKEYREKAEYFRTMSLKAEGALEVLSQLRDVDGND